MFGTEVKKNVVPARSSGGRRKWNEASYWQEVESRLDAGKVQALRKLYDWSAANADKIRWGTGVTKGSFNPAFTRISPISFISAFTDGTVQINYGYLEDVNLRKQLLGTLQKHIDVPGVTDISDDALSKWPTIPSDYVEHNIDRIIEALTEFIKS